MVKALIVVAVLLAGCASEKMTPITKQQTDALKAAAAPGDEAARKKAYAEP